LLKRGKDKRTNGGIEMEDRMEDRTMTCSICEAIIEDVCVLPPEVIARFYKWTGTINNINCISQEFWYCQKHSMEEIKVFEERRNNVSSRRTT
jgi:hypothetical protein